MSYLISKFCFFLEIDITWPAEKIHNAIEAIPGIGVVSVTKLGTCDNFDIQVEFVSRPGRQPKMKVCHYIMYLLYITTRHQSSSFSCTPG